MSDDIFALLSVFCPMHMAVDETGQITHCGASLEKLFAPNRLVGQRFDAAFARIRPRGGQGVAGVRAAQGGALQLELRQPRRTRLRGVAVPYGAGVIVNLGFGLSVLDAVRDYNLNAADFARTDMAIELLYLVEAKSAAMAASRRLNLRLQGARMAAEEAAITDSLTGLANRRAMERVLERLVQSGAPFAVMQVDLDHFKPVNDGFGHAAGDALLAHVAQVLGQETRQDDLAARVGGDEFVLLFAGIAERARLGQIAERIQRRLAEPFFWGDVACQISASIGITIAAGDARPAPVLLAEADAALYAAKHAGRAQHAFHLAPPAQ